MLYNNLSQEVYYLYIILCSDNSYYVDVTNDLDRQFQEHESGKYPTCYTFRRRPLKLAYFETVPTFKDAVVRETQINKWSRAKKQALVERNFHKLQLLAQCQNLTHCKYIDIDKEDHLSL